MQLEDSERSLRRIMKCGFKSIDITPPAGTPMGGNCRTDNISRGAHDPLKADIITFKSTAGDIALIDLDWCEAPLEIISSLKDRIVSETGLNYKRICITMTHTHSSPDVYGCFNTQGLTEMSKAYILSTASKLAEAVKCALLEAEEVLTGVGNGFVENISYNRRVFFKDGSLHMNWEILENASIKPEDLNAPEGPVDTDLFVVKFSDAQERLKAILVNYTLHPAVLVMEDMLFSKDYIWGLEEELKKYYGEDVLIYFSNGAEGNINHINMWDKNQGRSWNEARRIGKAIAGRVRELVDEIKVCDIETPEIIYDRLEIPVRYIGDEALEEAKLLWEKCGGAIPGLTDGVPEEWYAWNILKLAGEGIKSRTVELQAIKLGNAVIAALPGEMFAEFGLELKNKSSFRHTLLFGLANQSVGYIPTERAFRNRGYEPKTCEFSILAPEAGGIITGRLLELINILKGNT